MFRVDISLGRDVYIDLEVLIYYTYILMAACVGKAEHNGGRSRVEVPGSLTWINIDFQYWVPLANVIESGVGNVMDSSELLLNSSTAVALPALSAVSDNAMVARRWAG